MNSLVSVKMPNYRQSLIFIFGKSTKKLSRMFHYITLKNNIYQNVASGLLVYRDLSYINLYRKVQLIALESLAFDNLLCWSHKIYL